MTETEKGRFINRYIIEVFKNIKPHDEAILQTLIKVAKGNYNWQYRHLAIETLGEIKSQNEAILQDLINILIQKYDKDIEIITKVSQALASIKPKSHAIRQQIQNILKAEKPNFIQYDLQKSLEE